MRLAHQFEYGWTDCYCTVCSLDATEVGDRWCSGTSGVKGEPLELGMAALRALAAMSLPVQGGNEDPYCPFCAEWEPDAGASHGDDCAIVLACAVLGRRPPFHDTDGRRCS